MSTCWRKHKFSDGKEWSTFSDYPSAAYILVPLEQLDGLSPQEIGSRVLSLKDESRATDLLNWTDSYHNCWFEASRRDKETKLKYAALCSSIGPDSADRYREFEELKHLSPELQTAFDEIRAFTDETLNYLRTKKSKLTPKQVRARKILLELRNGCELCGLLDGKHTDACRNVRLGTKGRRVG